MDKTSEVMSSNNKIIDSKGGIMSIKWMQNIKKWQKVDE